MCVKDLLLQNLILNCISRRELSEKEEEKDKISTYVDYYKIQIFRAYS
jgi:hypothetical protein